MRHEKPTNKALAAMVAMNHTPEFKAFKEYLEKTLEAGKQALIDEVVPRNIFRLQGNCEAISTLLSDIDTAAETIKKIRANTDK
jgi:hypothetical protein